MPGGFPDDLIGLLPRERNSGMSDDDLEDLADYTKERQSGLLNDSSILDQTIALDSPGVDLDDNPLPMLSGQKRKKKK